VRQRTHEGFLRHAGFRWAQAATALSVAAIAAYFLVSLDEPPSGGSWLGYLLGTTGAGLIVWLACLGVRKRAVSNNAYLLKAWVSAHVYLGLSLIVVATLHTGFQFGWNVHTLAYGLMMLVIASGAVGVWAYSALPERLHAIRGADGKNTRKKMLEDIASLDEQLHIAAQPLDRTAAAIVRMSLEKTDVGGGFWTRLLGDYRHCANRAALARIQALTPGPVNRPETLEKIEALLQQKAEVLTLARRQMRVTALLEAWLFVHIPATFALLAALTAHIVSVFIYW
jgi:hypothetical protein